jgi:hypothetical protein
MGNDNNTRNHILDTTHIHHQSKNETICKLCNQLNTMVCTRWDACQECCQFIQNPKCGDCGQGFETDRSLLFCSYCRHCRDCAENRCEHCMIKCRKCGDTEGCCQICRYCRHCAVDSPHQCCQYSSHHKCVGCRICECLLNHGVCGECGMCRSDCCSCVAGENVCV